MARLVRFRVLDGIAIVSLDAPPVNALSAPLRAGLWQVFDRIAAQDDITAAVLRSEGMMFSAGADIREFGAKPTAPDLGQLCDHVEACPKPVVAAIHGQALGGGLELAMAAHYRLAAAQEAVLGLPEVALGLLPGAGGTQRLPRLIGADHALGLMVSGQSIDAPTALRLGLLDGLVEGDPASGAIAFARALVDKGDGPRPTRERREKMKDGRSYQTQVAKVRQALSGNPLFSPHLIVDCVEAAALLPFEAGCAMEADAFQRCMAHPQSVALRHVFLAERKVDLGLLGRDGAAFKPTDPAGRDLVKRLRQAQVAAATALVEAGHASEAEVDAAMVAFGFRKGPFGGREDGVENAGIVRRIVAAMLREGAAILEEGLVARPSDIDALAVHGLGFPRREGGPFRAAQTMGLLGLRKEMRHWAGENPLWTPPAILDEAVKDAAGFDVLN